MTRDTQAEEMRMWADLQRLPIGLLTATFAFTDWTLAAMTDPAALRTSYRYFVGHRRIKSDGSRVREWHERGRPCLTCTIRRSMLDDGFVGYTVEQVTRAFAEEWDP